MAVVARKRWEQGCDRIETINTIMEMYVTMHKLSEEKEQLVPMLPVGILVKWICTKFNISYTPECNDTLRTLWDVLSESAKKKLYGESRRDHEKVELQKRTIAANIEQLLKKITALSISENICPEKQNFFEIYQGPDIDGIISSFTCREMGCKKSFGSWKNLNRHHKTCHPWNLLPTMSSATTIVSTSSLPSSSFGGQQKRAALAAVGEVKRIKIDCKEGFPSDAHFRANATYRAKHGEDRPNGRNHIMMCNCPGMRPAAKNVVSHEGKHILNYGKEYFLCSGKAGRLLEKKNNTPLHLRKKEYEVCCDFFVFVQPPNVK